MRPVGSVAPGVEGRGGNPHQLAQLSLDASDAASVPAIVQNVVHENEFMEHAVTRLLTMLPKLGKATYDVVIKVVTDVGSVTAKKMLGL